MGLSPATATKQDSEQQIREIPRACFDCHGKGLRCVGFLRRRSNRMLLASHSTPWFCQQAFSSLLQLQRTLDPKQLDSCVTYWRLMRSVIGAPLLTCAHNSKCWRMWISCPAPCKHQLLTRECGEVSVHPSCRSSPCSG